MDTQQQSQIDSSQYQQENAKYILFGLEGETYGLSLLQIQEIIANYELTIFPNLPDYFDGVLSLRGEAIPLMNLRKRFCLPDKERNHRNRVIIIEIEPNAIGIEVDEVYRVATILQNTIEEPPALLLGKRSKFISGVSELDNNKFTILLDMQQVLSNIEKIELSEITKAIQDDYQDDEIDASSLGIEEEEPDNENGEQDLPPEKNEIEDEDKIDSTKEEN